MTIQTYSTQLPGCVILFWQPQAHVGQLTIVSL